MNKKLKNKVLEGQVIPSDKEFDDALIDYLENKSKKQTIEIPSMKNKKFEDVLKEIENMGDNLPSAPIEKMEPTKILESTEDFMKNKEIVKKVKDLENVPWEELSDVEKDRVKLNNLMRSARAYKSLADQGLSSYRKKIPEMLQAAKELAKKFGGSDAAKVLSFKLGKRGLKAIPVLGTGLGLPDSAKAASKGKYKTAAMETLSAIDPTPITDIVLAAKDISEEMPDEPPKRPKNYKALQAMGLAADMPMNASKIKTIKTNPAMAKQGLIAEPPSIEKLQKQQLDQLKERELIEKLKQKEENSQLLRNVAGEQDSPDIEEMDNALNYEDYLRKKKRQLGYE